MTYTQQFISLSCIVYCAKRTWIRQTKNVPFAPTDMTVTELKEKLLKERGVRVRDALELINKRSMVQNTERPTL